MQHDRAVILLSLFFAAILCVLTGLGSPAFALDAMSISQLKAASDGTLVHISGQVVTRKASNEFYIEDPQRAAGIAVVMSFGSDIVSGRVVTVDGVMATRGCERYVSGSTYSVTESGPALEPLAMTVRDLANSGGPLHLLSDPGFEQKTFTKWYKYLSHTASVLWNSQSLGPNYSQPHSGIAYAVCAKLANEVPLATPVTVALSQNCTSIPVGDYEASAWVKTPWQSSGWDGPGGTDQWVQMKVAVWSDVACTQLVKEILSPRIETQQPSWTRLSSAFSILPSDSAKAATLS